MTETVLAPPSTPNAKTAPAMLILGLDDKGRPHASRFRGAEGSAAVKAAGAMQMCAVAAEGEALGKLAMALPEGRIFASGKAFVPFVKQAVFDQLLNHLPEGAARPVRPAKSASAAPAPATRKPPVVSKALLPPDWSKIRLGSVVLASLEPEDGWWPAVITEDKGDGLFLLQWQGWDDWGPFLRKREQLALLHPDYSGA